MGDSGVCRRNVLPVTYPVLPDNSKGKKQDDLGSFLTYVSTSEIFFTDHLLLVNMERAQNIDELVSLLN